MKSKATKYEKGAATALGILLGYVMMSLLFGCGTLKNYKSSDVRSSSNIVSAIETLKARADKTLTRLTEATKTERAEETTTEETETHYSEPDSTGRQFITYTVTRNTGKKATETAATQAEQTTQNNIKESESTVGNEKQAVKSEEKTVVKSETKSGFFGWKFWLTAGLIFAIICFITYFLFKKKIQTYFDLI
ncbi:MAG: hypothetical protein LBR64_10800 [Dysgonamonadaceae bacterium]|jgi:cobalamin biosynthesis Mg chelatase CobN|nr:hypothetical protein [Dysgonamonadaceae bacterium]